MGLSYSTNLLEAPQDRNDGALAEVSAGYESRNGNNESNNRSKQTRPTKTITRPKGEDVNANNTHGEEETPSLPRREVRHSSYDNLVNYDEDFEEEEKVNIIKGAFFDENNNEFFERSESEQLAVSSHSRQYRVSEGIFCSRSCPSLSIYSTTRTMDEEKYEDDDEPTRESNLRNMMYNRKFHVVTTAALPWFTGTAVNPLLRAAYILKRSREEFLADLPYEGESQGSYDVNSISNVTLVIPWLIDEEDRVKVYGNSRVFDNEEQQENFIRSWMRESACLPEEVSGHERGLRIMFYPAKFHSGLGSIFAMGDICSLIRDEDADVAILEEPEHLNWYKAPAVDNWPKKFSFVIGVIHTNYKAYAWSTLTGILTAPAIQWISKLMAGYCHRIIKLSPVLQTFSIEKDVVSNIHGVRSEFLDEGLRRGRALSQANGNANTSGKAYFIGKLLWAKGLDLLLQFEELYKSRTGNYFEIDIYGTGPEEKEIIRAFHGRKKRKKNKSMSKSSSESSLSKIEMPKSIREITGRPIPARFKGRVDHAILKDEYKVFVNPSITEVLCTTTAEALAMGKFAGKFYLNRPLHICMNMISSNYVLQLFQHTLVTFSFRNSPIV